MGEPPLRLAPRHVRGKQEKTCSWFHCKINEERQDDCAGVVQTGEAATRPGHGRHQSGEFFLHTPLPPHLQRPHMKIHQAFADGLLVLDPVSAEKFKGTQAPTKNNLG